MYHVTCCREYVASSILDSMIELLPNSLQQGCRGWILLRKYFSIVSSVLNCNPLTFGYSEGVWATLTAFVSIVCSNHWWITTQNADDLPSCWGSAHVEKLELGNMLGNIFVIYLKCALSGIWAWICQGCSKKDGYEVVSCKQNKHRSQNTWYDNHCTLQICVRFYFEDMLSWIHPVCLWTLMTLPCSGTPSPSTRWLMPLIRVENGSGQFGYWNKTSVAICPTNLADW